MNDRRYSFADQTYLQAANPSVDWRSTVVDLLDFGLVCSEHPEKFNDWPLGLIIDQDRWPYAAEVGAVQILEQFSTRDVHYLIGEEDLLPSFSECPERVQGQDTLAKTLLYYWHLEQLGWGNHHRLHVVPNVGHYGRGNMTSALGNTAIFGPI